MTSREKIENITPSQVRAARALLAWSQKTLSAEAKIATSTVADFEREQRVPQLNNADAIRDALVKAGVKFLPGGAVIGPQPPLVHISRKGGIPMRWVNSTDLVQWGERRDAQASMAELLTKLIRAETGSASNLYFPSDESVQLGGWDGKNKVKKGSNYIPSGQSGWEIGTQRTGITKKADDDYIKRVANPLGLDRMKTTFVFVTPRRWKDKDTWVKQRRAERKWKDVQALDADDLVHWIEMHPAVGYWLAVKIGKHPPGMRRLEEVWEEWSLSTKPALTADLILADRDEQATETLLWLRGGPSIYAIQAEAAEEAKAFFHATIEQLPNDYRAQYLERILVADTPEVARAIGNSQTKMIIVLENAEQGLAARLVDQGHHVYVAYGPDAGISSDIKQLPRPSRYTLEHILKKMKLDVDDVKNESMAKQLAHDSARSLAVLRRLMPSALGRTPSWANGSPSRSLIAALIVGTWNEDYEGDKKVLEKITGEKYENIIANLAPLVGAFDSPIQKVGSAWKIASPRDAWLLLARNISEADFQNFEKACVEVFTSISPKFDMDGNERWLAASKGVQPEYSDLLRQGFGDTLILFSLFGSKAVSIRHASARAEAIVRDILKDADEKRWWSLSRDFERLAEAAPIAFLNAVYESLEQDKPSISVLFGEDDGAFGRGYISNLLWSLELLAWSPDYLGRVSSILARLAAIDPNPDSRYRNRPGNSLRQIFLLWLPQTNASLDQRIKIIDKLLETEPGAAWQLMLGIFPAGYDTSHNSAEPRWRDFSADNREPITNGLIWRAAEELTKRILKAVGVDPNRWLQLIEMLPSLAPDRRVEALDLLTSTEPKITDDKVRIQIWSALRGILNRHRAFPSSGWALPKNALDKMELAYNALEPCDAIAKVSWLFRGHVPLPQPTPHKKDSDGVQAWKEDEAKVDKLRFAVVADFVSSDKSDLIFKLAETVEHPALIGVAVARLSDKISEKKAILIRALKGDQKSYHALAHGLMITMFGNGNMARAEKLLAEAKKEKWDKEIIIRILRALPQSRWTWEKASSISQEIDHLYWQQCGVVGIEGNTEDLVYALEKFMEVGRAKDAIHMMGYGRAGGKRVPDAVTFRVLMAAAQEPWTSKEGNEAVMFQHFLVETLKGFDKSGTISDDEMARIEWAFLPILRFSDRPPLALHKALATSPAFFVEALSCLYRAKKAVDEEAEAIDNSENMRAMANQAFELLRTWKRVPGTGDDGVVNEAALEAWIKEARELCKKADRADVGDSQIGQMLAFAPADEHGIWPATPVRNVLEKCRRSGILERGIIIGRQNSRGVTTRGMKDGGEQERDLAAYYRKCSKVTSIEWPKISSVLEILAKSYEGLATLHDEDAEKIEW